MDTTPIAARLSAIANSVNALKTLQSLTLEEFVTDPILHAAAERHFQVAIQAAIDIASILLASESIQIPDSYKEIFYALAETNIVPAEFAQKLASMAGFRNVLVHLYLVVDLERVFQYLQTNLEDFELFAKYVSEYIAQKG